MRKRTRKLLSIVLASAMVLSMHSMAFAAEEEASGPKITIQDDGSAFIEKTTDPVSWNGTANEEEIGAILFGGRGEHFANGKKVPVSSDGWFSSSSLSANIYAVDGAEGYYLVSAYGGENGIGEVAGSGLAAIASYDGRSIVYNPDKPDTASKKDGISVYLSLVKYDSSAKTVTEINGVTPTVKVKNNKNANVSANKIYDKDGHGSYQPISGKSLGTFTVGAKVKFAKGTTVDKAVKKGITKTLKDKTFNLAIKRMKASIENLEYAFGSDGKVSENEVTWTGDIINHKVNGDIVTAKKVNTKSGKVTLTYGVWVGDKHVSKTISPKEYTTKTVTLTDDTLVVLESFSETGNFEYASSGFTGSEYGFKWAWRVKDKKNFKAGAYKDDANNYVDSVE